MLLLLFLLISSVFALWIEHIVCMICIIYHLLEFSWYPKLLLIFNCLMCVCEKNYVLLLEFRVRCMMILWFTLFIIHYFLLKLNLALGLFEIGRDFLNLVVAKFYFSLHLLKFQPYESCVIWCIILIIVTEEPCIIVFNIFECPFSFLLMLFDLGCQIWLY